MDKEKYIKALSEKLNCDMEYAKKVADLLDDNFCIGKNNQKKTIDNLMNNLNISYEEADNIYNVSSSIIAKEIKNKIFHPFKKD